MLSLLGQVLIVASGVVGYVPPPVVASPAPVVDAFYARRFHLKAVRVLKGGHNPTPRLDLQESFRFSPTGRLLAHDEPALWAMLRYEHRWQAQARQYARERPQGHQMEVRNALGQTLVLRSYDETQALDYVSYTHYNQRAQPTQVITFFEWRVSTYAWTYDARGNCIGESSGQYWDDAERHVYRYDAQNRLIANARYRGQFEHQQTDSTCYNADGTMRQQASYSYVAGQPGPLQPGHLTTYAYDTARRLTRRVEMHYVNEKDYVNYLDTFRYRSDGQLIEKSRAQADVRGRISAGEALCCTLDSLLRGSHFEQSITRYRFNLRGQLIEQAETALRCSSPGGPYVLAAPQLTRWQYDYYH